MKFFFIVVFWIISLIAASIYTYENPEKIDFVKYYFKTKENPETKLEKGIEQTVIANSFNVKFSKEISFSNKTAFIIHEGDDIDFDKNLLKIYFQNGYLTENLKTKKLNLPKSFTIQKNGGVKTIFVYDDNDFALISSFENKCYFASIISLNNGVEVFKTNCLPEKHIDFNGLGSSNVHLNNKIFLSIGAPEQASSEIRELAQSENSVFGKIIEIDELDLDKILKNQKSNLQLKVYTKGHRNPQGLTKIGKNIFSVEHGPRGGDELNRIIEGKNYGWPTVSYGTQYFYEKGGKAYDISHEKNNFEEPLFALVPSVGISGLSQCPKKLREYYKKPCLIALSLYGNSLRSGKSLIIYLLNEEKNQVHSVEQIFLRDDLKFRHFVTNSKNELYEDKEGNIYISADKKGIYKISFIDFRS